MRTNRVRYQDAEGDFEVTLPASWRSRKDGEAGLLLFDDEGEGLLHLIPFSRDPDDELDAAEELYAFLAEHEIELEEDEVEDVELAGEGLLALCAYLAEEDGEEEYCLVGVAVAPGQILLASYSCPAGDDEAEAKIVRGILASIAFGTRS